MTLQEVYEDQFDNLEIKFLDFETGFILLSSTSLY